MKNKLSKSSLTLAALFLLLLSVSACQSAQNGAAPHPNTFRVVNPDYKSSPNTGMMRRHWVDAAHYILQGAFSYIDSLDAPMKFPKQHDKTYPRNDGQVPTEKLEGLCRTLFVAAPLLKENPDLEMNGIKVADYYRYQILNLINPESPSFIQHRPHNGGPSQNLVEFGALAISLFVIPEVIWEPFTQAQKDELAAVMISYGDGPTVNSNWKFFNIFVLSFFKDQGYEVNESLLVRYLDEALDFYRGQGWYNDSPAYDYYSMWAFQTYGPVWAQLFGNKYYPEHARKFMSHLRDMADNYPYMFNRDGKMNMWGRSIPYRFGAVAPLAMLGYLNDATIDYGWMRNIASSTMLQFLQHPNFLEDNVPTLGFYGPFAPVTQIYSCRGSVYWCGKVFLALLLPEDNIFWTAVENKGPWEKELKADNVYNKFQKGSELLITDYPNSGAAEMRSWCHETVAGDWQKFRSTENYNKLAYNTEFPWMADGENGEISMNYGVQHKDDQWEALRLYTFRKFENEIYYRDAVLETNREITFRLADIPIPNGIIRVDKMITPVEADVRLGHYSLPERALPIEESTRKVKEHDARIITNGDYQLAMIPLVGWQHMQTVYPKGLHPESESCGVSMAIDKLAPGEKIYVTLHLWKKGDKAFTDAELTPVSAVEVVGNGAAVELLMANGEKKRVEW